MQRDVPCSCHQLAPCDNLYAILTGSFPGSFPGLAWPPRGAGHFVDSLKEMGVGQELIDEAAGVLIGVRPLFDPERYKGGWRRGWEEVWAVATWGVGDLGRQRLRICTGRMLRRTR